MKQIPNYLGYKITKGGRVWSDKTQRWLKTWIDAGGYPMVSLRRDGKTFNRYNHRLTLETFVGPCPQNMECCHEDGNGLNCNLRNLRWDTRSGNRKDAIRHGTLKAPTLPGETNPNAILSEQSVRTIIYIYRTGIMTVAEVAELYAVSVSAISSIANKRSWKHLWSTAA